MSASEKSLPPVRVLLNSLARLQEIELLTRPGTAARAERDRLRSTIPEPILVHYDRMMARGKKGIVVVHNETCTGCHLRLAMGMIMALKRAEDVQLCENCGRYLRLPEEPEGAVPATPRKQPTRGSRQVRGNVER